MSVGAARRSACATHLRQPAFEAVAQTLAFAASALMPDAPADEKWRLVRHTI